MGKAWTSILSSSSARGFAERNSGNWTLVCISILVSIVDRWTNSGKSHAIVDTYCAGHASLWLDPRQLSIARHEQAAIHRDVELGKRIDNCTTGNSCGGLAWHHRGSNCRTDW